jgi:GxxExxY protein
MKMKEIPNNEISLALRAQVPDEWNRLTSRVIGCAMEVHTQLGPGLLESIYEDALCHELTQDQISFQRQLSFPIQYKGLTFNGQRCDVFVSQLVVLELKSVEAVHDKHLATLSGYMRFLDAPLGLLIDFNAAHLRDGIYRRINSRSTKFGIFNTSLTPPRTSA